MPYDKSELADSVNWIYKVIFDNFFETPQLLSVVTRRLFLKLSYKVSHPSSKLQGQEVGKA